MGRRKVRTRLGMVALLLLAGLASACDGGNFSFAPVTLTGTTLLRVDTPTAFTATGSGFMQGMGAPTVTFRALTGTPFAGGTSDEAQVMGTVVDDTTVTAVTPVALVSGTVPIEVVVTAPAGISSMPLATTVFAPLVWGLGDWGGAEWD